MSRNLVSVEQDASEARSSFMLAGDIERYRDNPDERDNDSFEDAPVTEDDYNHYRDSARSRWLDRLAQRIPKRVQATCTRVCDWTKGPDPPRTLRITPLFAQVQQIPLALLEKYAPLKSQRIGLLFMIYIVWLLAIGIILGKHSTPHEILAGQGRPVRISCDAKAWERCGLDGEGCGPFANATFSFRCPADCRKEIVQNPHAVGDQEVVYEPLVIGGPKETVVAGAEIERLVNNATYRGDSFICASAVHAGVFGESTGGCGVLSLQGEQADFQASRRNGISSKGFDSYFPQTFGFQEGTKHHGQCKDPRWSAFWPSLVLTAVLSLFTTSPAVHFWSLFTAIFFHVALISDHPDRPNYASLLAVAFGRFLPSCFCMWVMYRYSIRRSLSGLTAQVEKTILWLGAAWIGALNNYTFDWIPIQRLTPHDIQAQPGAVPALIGILTVIILVALGQAWSFRQEGRMRRYLVIYGLMAFTLIVMIIVPGLNLRIHHYILGLLFLPGTSFQTRPSLFYQGLLVGLFINGVGRWGFAPILEAPAELLRGAQQGSLIPIVSVIATTATNITFAIGPLPIWDATTRHNFDGVSVLVNDVERLRSFHNIKTEEKSDNITWTWERHIPTDVLGEQAVERASAFPEYFRFGYLAGKHIAVDREWTGERYFGDYSRAGTWTSNGTWLDIPPGPS